jgi:hypothetical protein
VIPKSMMEVNSSLRIFYLCRRYFNVQKCLVPAKIL